MSYSPASPHFLPPELFFKILHFAGREVRHHQDQKWFSSLRLVSRSWNPFVQYELFSSVTVQFNQKGHLDRLGELLLSDTEKSSLVREASVDHAGLYAFSCDSLLDLVGSFRSLMVLHVDIMPMWSSTFRLPQFNNLRKLSLRLVDGDGCCCDDMDDADSDGDAVSLPFKNFSSLRQMSNLTDLSLFETKFRDEDWIEDAGEATFRLRNLSLEGCDFGRKTFDSLFGPSGNTLENLKWKDTQCRERGIAESICVFRDSLKKLDLEECVKTMDWSTVSSSFSFPRLSTFRLACAYTSLASFPSSSSSSSSPGSSSLLFPNLDHLTLQIFKYTSPGTLRRACEGKSLPWTRSRLKSFMASGYNLDTDDLDFILDSSKDQLCKFELKNFNGNKKSSSRRKPYKELVDCLKRCDGVGYLMWWRIC